jgi:hypothetical protein
MGAMSYGQMLAQDLGYGQTTEPMNLLEEIGRQLNADARAILASGFSYAAALRQDIKGAALG